VGWYAFIERIKPDGDEWTGVQGYTGIHPTPYQDAVIAWAGAITDFLCGWPLDDWPVVERKVFEAVEIPSLEHFGQHYELLFAIGIDREKSGGPPFREAGYGDRLSINWCRQKWRALRKSWQIVVSRRGKIAALAKTLLHYEKVQSETAWGSSP
jgi:hypothetical protein